MRDPARCVTVKVGPLQKQKTFPAGTPAKKIQHWKDEVRVALRAGRVRTPHTPIVDLRAEAMTRYLPRMKATLGKASYRSRVCEIEAWFPALGHRPRHGEGALTRDDFREVRDSWCQPGDRQRAPKTCNHRVRAMKHLYRELDGTGRHGPTPLDTIPKLKEPDANPKFVDVRVIKKVASTLTEPITRARFMVLASTGQRPAQLMRAEAGDVDVRRGVWMVRPAKGGNRIPLILTDDMKAAWRVFIAADAWGAFDTSDHAKRLYAAGWPKDVRPYNAKHTVAITLANSPGAEWEDVKDFFGQTDVRTTRIYTGQVLSRLRTTSARLAGRIGW